MRQKRNRSKRLDYQSDRYGRECLELSQRSKSALGFGAVLVKEGQILGQGWNRRSTPEERKLLTHVDYAIHAEQAALIDALSQGWEIKGSEIYVLGMILLGPMRGRLTVREKPVFICKRCPPSLLRFAIFVNVPQIRGWVRLSPEQALQTSQKLCGNGYWERFIRSGKI